MKINYYTFFIVNFFFSILIVFASFFFEFYYNLEPCKLCFIQRFGWIFFTIISFLALFLGSYKKLVTILTIIVLSLLSLIGIYHSGVEVGILDNFLSCTTSSGLEAKSIEELSKIIMNTDNSDCAFPKYSFFGLTLANLGVLSSFFLLFINLLLLKKLLVK